jgi:hypothetical protein
MKRERTVVRIWKIYSAAELSWNVWANLGILNQGWK